MSLNKFKQGVMRRNLFGAPPPIAHKPLWRQILIGFLFSVFASAVATVTYPYIKPTILPIFIIGILASVAYAGIGAGISALASSIIASYIVFQSQSEANGNIWNRILTLAVTSLIACWIYHGRVMAEESAHDSELRVRKLADNHADAIFTIDSNSIIYYANKAAAEMFGHARMDMVGKSLEIIMPKRLRQHHHMGMRRYVESGVKKLNWNSIEITGLHKDGHEFPIEISFGEFEQHGVKFFSGFIKNISKRKEIEDKLRESEERFKMVSDSVPAMIWLSDEKLSRYFFNQRWLEFRGRRLEQELGEGWQEGIHPEDREQFLSTYTTNFAEKKAYKMEYRLLRNDGKYRWILAEGIPRITDDGEFKGFIGACIDITERKELEHNLVAALDEAKSASEAKDRFLAVLSHELKTPLSSILGYANILSSGKINEKPEQVKAALDSIQRNARTQVDMIDDLLDVSRIISGKIVLKPLIVGVPSLVQQICDDMQIMAADKTVTLNCDCCSDKKLFVNGDPQRLTQIITNIINNAIKFTSPKGRVDVSLVPRGIYLDIVVKDTGIGIDPKFLPYLFERFRQDEKSRVKSRGGLGLGLSIVKSLIDLHGGSVKAESEGEGKGATFTITLPLSSPPVGEPSVREKIEIGEGMANLAGKRVLLVDDDEDTLTMLKLVIEKYGASAITASSADEARTAIGTIEDAKGIPDIIICDVGMPKEDGFTFMKWLRANGNNLPAVALTAFTGDEYAREAIESGFQHYLSKPVELRELIWTIHSLASIRS